LMRDFVRANKNGQPKKALICLAVAVFLLAGVVAFTFSGIGIVSDVEASKALAYDSNVGFGASPVELDARRLASQLYGDSPDSIAYGEQLLTAYYQSFNSDVIILFNPGGWGTRKLHDSVGWTSIVKGMQNELNRAGYIVVTLNYQRTQNSLPGQLNEIREMFTGYPDKANHLAQLAVFLTDHLPRTTVIMAAESTGTVICDSTMKILKDDDRIFSIQTGSPFWYNATPGERTLLVNDNGLTPDSFNQGDLSRIIGTSLRSLIESKKIEERGEILGFISAPGHEYWWQDPGVSPRVEKFLSRYFENIPEVQNLNN
jgi:hypothetical protein